jgi:hypothetical protein
MDTELNPFCHTGLSGIFLRSNKDSRQAPIEARLHTGQAGMTVNRTLQTLDHLTP